MFNRRPSTKCFFCHTPATHVRDPANFQCDACGCWNRYDQRSGEILSYDPAMHEPAMNQNSFARRGSPSKGRLLTMQPGQQRDLFCRSCTINQNLLVSLLSDYLPPPESPDYESRLASLPAYKESLHARYPPVCENCQPNVEERIRQQNYMARTTALGGMLQHSKRLSVSVEPPDRREIHHRRANFATEMFLWKMRGCLWIISLLLALTGYISGAFSYPLFQRFDFITPYLTLLSLLSILWTAWDPTYSTVQRIQRQGRDVRVRGKSRYLRLQVTSWALRLVTSIVLTYRHYGGKSYFHWISLQTYFTFATLLELYCQIGSFMTLRVTQPPSIRLIDNNNNDPREDSSRATSPFTSPEPPTAGSSKRPNQPPTDLDPLAQLSLSSKPVTANPVFGLPSLLSSNPPPAPKKRERDADEMDWTPTGPDPAGGMRRGGPPMQDEDDEDGYLMRPQRFFPPEKPTGLEGLFESAVKLVDDTVYQDAPSGSRRERRIRWQTKLALVALGALVVPFIGILYRIWRLSRLQEEPLP